MNKEQEEKFEKFYADDPIAVSGIKENQRIGWAACLEANGIGEEPRIPEGYFKIGEDAECKRIEDIEPIKGRIGFISYDGGKVAFDKAIIRRIPAWKPREGESIMFKYGGVTCIGVIHDGVVYAESHAHPYAANECRPVDYDRIGKPWSDI